MFYTKYIFFSIIIVNLFSYISITDVRTNRLTHRFTIYAYLSVLFKLMVIVLVLCIAFLDSVNPLGCDSLLLSPAGRCLNLGQFINIRYFISCVNLTRLHACCALDTANHEIYSSPFRRISVFISDSLGHDRDSFISRTVNHCMDKWISYHHDWATFTGGESPSYDGDLPFSESVNGLDEWNFRRVRDSLVSHSANRISESFGHDRDSLNTFTHSVNKLDQYVLVVQWIGSNESFRCSWFFLLSSKQL